MNSMILDALKQMNSFKEIVHNTFQLMPVDCLSHCFRILFCRKPHRPYCRSLYPDKILFLCMDECTICFSNPLSAVMLSLAASFTLFSPTILITCQVNKIDYFVHNEVLNFPSVIS